jgi:hypothetical protein
MISPIREGRRHPVVTQVEAWRLSDWRRARCSICPRFKFVAADNRTRHNPTCHLRATDPSNLG